jgi:O-antigen ligase
MPFLLSARGAQRVFLVCAAAFLVVAPFPSSAGWRVFFLLSAAIALVVDAWREHAALGVRRVPRSLALAWVAWVLLAALSLAWSLDPGYSIDEIRREMLYGGLAFLVFFLGTADATRLRLWIGVLLTAGLVLMAGEWLRFFLPDASWVHRVSMGPGPFSTHVLMLAALLAVCVWPGPTGLGLGRGFAVCACVALLAAGMASESRMLWLALLVAALAAFMVYRRAVGPDHPARRAVTAAFVASLLLMPLLMAASAEYKLRYYPRASSATDSLGYDERPPVWQAAARLIVERPWLGYGYGRDIVASDIRAAAAAAGSLNRLNHGHNMFVDAALQMGVPGVAVLAALFVALGVALTRLARRVGGEPLAIAGVALVAGYVVKNSTDDFFIRPSSLIFWAIAGMLAGLGSTLARR